MPQLGVEVITRTAPPAGTTFTKTDQAILVGVADQGLANTGYTCHSTADVAAAIGPRSATNQTLYDAADVAFREGLTTAVISRVVGPTPVNASVVLKDSEAKPTLKVTAKYPGTYANGYKINVTVVSGEKRTIEVQNASGEKLEISGTINSRQEATEVSFANITVALEGTSTKNAEKGIFEITSGTDDRTDITAGAATTTAYKAAVDGTSALGAGQVAAPGQANAEVWQVLLNHAATYNRSAVLDVGKGTKAELETKLATIRGYTNAQYGAPIVGNLTAPGTVAGTTRTVAGSAVACALAARGDATGSPNVAPCGLNYPLVYCTATDTDLNAEERNSVFNAGGNMFHYQYGVLALYGWQTPVESAVDSIYDQFNHTRTRMAIVSKGKLLGAGYQFGDIDGRGTIFLAFKNSLAGELNELLQVGALYGETAADAYAIDVGPTVNTVESINKQEIKAVVAVRMSPYASRVLIELVSVPTTQAVSA